MVQPPRYMPIALIERRLKQDIGVNLEAIREHACQVGSCSQLSNP